MKSRLLASCGLTLMFTMGCGGLLKGKGAAETAIQHFHQQMNDKKFEDIWNGAHEEFRKASKKEKYDEFMGAIHRKLGKVVSTSNAGWRVNTQNLITTVLMSQKTVFESGEGVESFTFRLDGDQAILIGYNIQSTDLITK